MHNLIELLDKKITYLKEKIVISHQILKNEEGIDLIILIDQIGKKINRLDILFISHYERWLKQKGVLKLSDLSHDDQQAFKPVQDQIQLIRDLEAILRDDAHELKLKSDQIKQEDNERAQRQLKISRYKNKVSKPQK